MRAKYTCLIVAIVMSLGALAQTTSFDSSGYAYQTRMFDTSGIIYYDSLSKITDKLTIIPDSLLKTIDTTQRRLIAQQKTTDTITTVDTASSKPKISTPLKKYDKRWYISPALKFQFQDFGMLEKQRLNYLSDAHLHSFYSKGNASASLSVYKNFSGHFSMSADIGMSYGRVTDTSALISSVEKKLYNAGNATLYYHLLGGHFRLQPFIAAGINHMMKDGSYTSAPVGAGVKFSGEKIMIEAQTAYGFAVSKNIAPTIMYSLGVYIPLKSKKHKREEAAGKNKDTSSINITNITNNYYFLNTDSLKRAQEDSIKKLSDSHFNDKSGGEEDELNTSLDPDDPMNLPAAEKYIVYFYYDQYALSSGAFAEVDKVIHRMKENKKLHVHLKGHTDMAGSEQYNSPLSKKRAQMVFDYMNSRGIALERMILSSYGKMKPVVKDEDPNTAWMNRRCEMVLFEAE